MPPARWLDVAKRDYDDTLLAACGLSRAQMPAVCNRVTGTLLPAVARALGLREIPVVAGGGDNAAGAVGVGIVRPGDALLSLGTSAFISRCPTGSARIPNRPCIASVTRCRRRGT